MNPFHQGQLPMAMNAVSALPAEELTTVSYKILLHEIVVTVFADAEFKAVMGDHSFV